VKQLRHPGAESDFSLIEAKRLRPKAPDSGLNMSLEGDFSGVFQGICLAVVVATA